MTGAPMLASARRALRSPALAVARSLEEGRLDGAAARLLARAWGLLAARAVARPVDLPSRTRVVAVGGATLGGSGKTPLAIACARALAAQGAHVVLVGHAYGARPGRARIVAPDDAPLEVGDEALLSARALAPCGVQVVVAPSRSGAVAFAGRCAQSARATRPVLVLDGVLQTAPVRVALALLAVDAAEPWGAGHVPPRGDLRAPIPALLAAADSVVAIGDAVADARARLVPASLPADVLEAEVASRGARLGDALLSWEELARLRVGLACALARPTRLLSFLRRRGVVPVAIARSPDHAPIDPRAFVEGAAANDDVHVDVWLATPKCALHVPPVGAWRAARPPVATIDYDVVISRALSAELAAAVAP
jgi:tetraacyldisaccharide 4'-kinase